MLNPAHLRKLASVLIALIPSAMVRADLIQVGSQAGAQIFFNNTLVRTYNFGITSSGSGLDLT